MKSKGGNVKRVPCTCRATSMHSVMIALLLLLLLWLEAEVWALFSFSPPFIFLSWRLITLQYCSGFCHTFTWISHGFTCIPIPDPPSRLPLHPIPLSLPSAPALSTCLMQLVKLQDIQLTHRNPLHSYTLTMGIVLSRLFFFPQLESWDIWVIKFSILGA